jgi:3-oxoacyl-[acyl-carrier protein] reductase
LDLKVSGSFIFTKNQNMNLDLTGKRAMVCGSTQGIGKAAAIELALLGASVVLVARNEEKLRQTVTELAGGPNLRHSYLVADFGSPETLKSVVEEYVAGEKVHVLINNTGGPPPGPALNASPEEFTKAFSNHLICNQILVQAVTPGMKSEKFGRIINVISTSVKIPLRNMGVSNTIRGAVANWAKTLSVELAPFGITVNNVLPGASMTGRLESLIRDRSEKQKKTIEAVIHEMEAEIPAGRISSAFEVAAAIAFLSTPAAAYINGINVPVDGGRTGSL